MVLRCHSSCSWTAAWCCRGVGGSFAVSLAALASAGVRALAVFGSLLLHSAGRGAAAASALRGRTAFGRLSASAPQFARRGRVPLPALTAPLGEGEGNAAFRAARDRSSGPLSASRRLVGRLGTCGPLKKTRPSPSLKSMSLVARLAAQKRCPAGRMRVNSPYKTSHIT